MSFAFVKGHGTGNDFVVLPDPDGSVHGDLAADGSRALCDRRGGHRRRRRAASRAPRSDAAATASGSWTTATPTARSPRCAATVSGSSPATSRARAWSTHAARSRRHARRGQAGDVLRRRRDQRRHGRGRRRRAGQGRRRGPRARGGSVDIGNPHAVAFVETLDEAGDLRDAPDFSSPTSRRASTSSSPSSGRLARSRCGSTSVGWGRRSRAAPEPARSRARPLPATSVAAPTTYRIDVPGGVVSVTYDAAGQLHLKGPAVLVAEGVWTV